MGSSMGTRNGGLPRETFPGAGYEEASVVCDAEDGYVFPLIAVDAIEKVSTEADPLVWEYGEGWFIVGSWLYCCCCCW